MKKTIIAGIVVAIILIALIFVLGNKKNQELQVSADSLITVDSVSSIDSAK